MLLVGEFDGNDWTTPHVTSGELDQNRNLKWSIEGSGFLSSHFENEHQTVKVLLRHVKNWSWENEMEKREREMNKKSPKPLAVSVAVGKGFPGQPTEDLTEEM